MWLIIHRWRFLILLLPLGALGWFALLHQRMPRDLVPAALVPKEASWAPALKIEPAIWQAMQSDSARGSEAVTPGLPYRLAGTFTQAGAQGSNRIAIIDDLRDRRQYLLREKEVLDEYQVESVFTDRVVLLRDGERHTLWPEGARPTVAQADQATDAAPPKTFAEVPALEVSRFGKRIGPARWVFEKDKLVAYQQELLDNPERLARLYLSFKHDKTEAGDTKGFAIAPAGEEEFFNVVGLQENDVVRKINSMAMTSERRAEVFLKEFAKDRLDALVLDIEREGETVQHIYIFQ